MWFMAWLQLLRVAWSVRQRLALEAVPVKLEPEVGRHYPPVSIIIPARNEAETIESCLAGAHAQTYPDLEIVVVDDRSQDGTGDKVRAICAADRRVKLIEGQPLPEGWVGKCWALHQGSQAARGEWLLFVDADTRLSPGAVTGSVDEARRREVPVLSALTGQELPTLWERVIQPAVFAALADAMPATLVNDPNYPSIAIANGQFLLVRRDAYQDIGGHAAIRGEIAEDVQFAKRAKRLRWGFWLGDGRYVATTRMYTTPAALWEGWTKNLHVGARLHPWLLPPGIIYIIVALVAPYWSFYWGVRQRSRSLVAAGAVQLASSLAARRVIDATVGVPAIYTLSQPFGQLAFLLLLAGSFYKVMSGQGVTWKGRRYYA